MNGREKYFSVGEHLIHLKCDAADHRFDGSPLQRGKRGWSSELEPGQLEASPIQNLPGSFFWASPCICHVDFSWHVDAMGRRIGFAPSNCLAFTHSLDQTLAKLAHL